ncbi:MAG: alpha/beta fold hydrolase [Woeseiaceae bacterium]
MFTGFERKTVRANSINLHIRVGGEGPGLLLLHGHPQTHYIWHKIADRLAKEYTVVAADLRGYGDSDKPGPTDGAINYSKRVMAQDQLALMSQLGFERFSILAHDRGARVAHRLAQDHPHSVQRMILLDIAPTLAMYEQTSQEFAKSYWHWFFLIRPTPFPESLIDADPERYLRSIMGARFAGMQPFSDEAFGEYLRCLRLPGAATGICEDYRASAGIDLEHDREDIDAGNKLTCPLLVLWGDSATVGRCFFPLAEWEKVAIDVTGSALPSGHYIAEEVPELLLDYVLRFLDP